VTGSNVIICTADKQSLMKLILIWMVYCKICCSSKRWYEIDV